AETLFWKNANLSSRRNGFRKRAFLKSDHSAVRVAAVRNGGIFKTQSALLLRGGAWNPIGHGGRWANWRIFALRHPTNPILETGTFGLGGFACLSVGLELHRFQAKGICIPRTRCYVQAGRSGYDYNDYSVQPHSARGP